MKIAIIGTHFTGKTTLVEDLHSFYSSKNRDVVAISEAVRKCPLPVNRETTFESQLWILMEQVKSEIENARHEIVITDRSVIDNYAYMVYKFPEKARPLLHFVIEYAKSYDYIFKTCCHDSLISDDGFRNIDPVFRSDIEKVISGLLDSHNIGYVKIPKENQLDFVRGMLGQV